jgi:hypothetical protein
MVVSEAEMNAALVRELCSGRMFMEERQKIRELECAKEAAIARDQGTKNWKLLAIMPQHDNLIVGEKYGQECWQDKEFVRYFQKSNPHLAVHKI